MRMRLLAATVIAALNTTAGAMPAPVAVETPAALVTQANRSLPYPYASPIKRVRPSPQLRAFRHCMRENYGPRYYYRVNAQRRFLMARVCGL
ncbi:MAG: hypothetical protein ACRC7G_01585 [Beijerinckiaceae bacterium]